jgi:hypothetical protein
MSVWRKTGSCTLVVLDARPGGTKELIGVEDGFREEGQLGQRAARPEAPRHAIPELAIAMDAGLLGALGMCGR